MQPIKLLADMHALLNFSDADRQRLIEMGPLLTAYGEELASMFYSALDSVPESKSLLDASPTRRMSLHSTLIGWYTDIFSGKYDEAYAQRRWIIGLVHVRIGIPPMFVVGSMENVYRFSAGKLAQSADKLKDQLPLYVESLTKMLNTDLAFIEQSYSESTLRAMAAEMGADEKLVQRFAVKGADELLEEARAGRFS